MTDDEQEFYEDEDEDEDEEFEDPPMRTEEEIFEAENEFFEKVWFGRNTRFVLKENGEEVLEPRHEISRPMVEDLLKKYGEEALVPKDDFEWGMLNGKLSALRWVLGEEWDFLDT